MKWTEKELCAFLLKYFKSAILVNKNNFNLELIYEERTYKFIVKIPNPIMSTYITIKLTTDNGREVGTYLTHVGSIEYSFIHQMAVKDIQKRIEKKRRENGEDIKYNILRFIQEELLKSGYKTTKFKSGKDDIILYNSAIVKIFIMLENSDIVVKFGECRNNIAGHVICSLNNPQTDMCEEIMRILHSADTIMRKK